MRSEGQWEGEEEVECDGDCDRGQDDCSEGKHVCEVG